MKCNWDVVVMGEVRIELNSQYRCRTNNDLSVLGNNVRQIGQFLPGYKR